MIVLNRQDAGDGPVGQRRVDNGLPTKIGCQRPAIRLEAQEPPADIAAAVEWVREHSMKVRAMDNPALLRPALDALARRTDGQLAAENTVRRRRMVLSNFLKYTVEEKGLLTANPLTRVDWTPPETDDELDFRYVPGPA